MFPIIKFKVLSHSIAPALGITLLRGTFEDFETQEDVIFLFQRLESINLQHLTETIEY